MAPILGRMSVGDGEWESDSLLELERSVLLVVDSAARGKKRWSVAEIQGI